jgi:hypothetical protein
MSKFFALLDTNNYLFAAVIFAILFIGLEIWYCKFSMHERKKNPHV